MPIAYWQTYVHVTRLRYQSIQLFTVFLSSLLSLCSHLISVPFSFSQPFFVRYSQSFQFFKNSIEIYKNQKVQETVWTGRSGRCKMVGGRLDFICLPYVCGHILRCRDNYRGSAASSKFLRNAPSAHRHMRLCVCVYVTVSTRFSHLFAMFFSYRYFVVEFGKS